MHHHLFRQTFSILTLISLGTATPMANAEENHGYDAHTIQYTGGDYKDETFGYRLLTPEKIEPGKKYPVILFLHGAGERGDDNKIQLKHFPVLMSEPARRKKFPCFVIAPQCRTDRRWVEVDWGSKKSTPTTDDPGDQMKMAIAILKEVQKNHPTDDDRVYLTGLSMGGYGSWDLAARHPDWFAAAAPICGGGDETKAKQLAELPLWAFHGDADQAVPVGRSRTMIDAIRQAGGEPKYTEYPKLGHHSWVPAYSDKSGLLDWLFEQKLGDRAK